MYRNAHKCTLTEHWSPSSFSNHLGRGWGDGSTAITISIKDLSSDSQCSYKSRVFITSALMKETERGSLEFTGQPV